MANSDISVSSVDHRQEPSPSTTFSIYGLAAVSITYLHSILAPILGHQMEHVSKIDRRTTKHGARFRITVPEDRQRNIIQRLERQSKQTHWRIRQNYRHRRPDQPRPTAPPPPLSRQILAVNVANISNKRPAIRHIVRNIRLWAISETCITSSKFRFTVPGFDVIQHPATGPGRRGIALGIPSCFGGHEHGSAVGTMILAKVPNFTPECLWIVGSVYVGHSGATTNYSRREAFASIRQALDRVVPFDNNHSVLIFGDWNTDPQRLQRIVHSWGHGLTVMQFSGSQITRLSTVHGRRHSSIDHFVCNAPARALFTSPRVDRQTAVADHFVICTSIRAEAQGQPPAPRAPTISRHHCLEATDRIATSNYWDVLADGASDNTDTDTDIHQLTSQFLESANAVADNLIQCNTLRDEWSRLKAAATQLERVDGRKQWVKHADNLDRAVSDGRTDLVFAAARAMSGNSSRSAAVTPLYNSNGIVQYDPTSTLRVMQGHYGSLAADTTGHSLDLQYWHDRQPIQVFLNTPTIRNSDILDQDFSWNQIAAALLQMSLRKAPGDDVFASATIPRAWLCASIVSIDKKDGDPLNPGDKRSIALINVGLKLVCKVLQMRIKQFVEANNLLSYEQAGFRKREECVGQVVSLVDIIQRRQNAGINTHVLFIDIQKAFDTVPVGALLWKLQNMGFPRRTLAFLKALYTSSSARARAGSLLSDPFPVQRGVRQGCPLSGLLFNLFINDILDDVAPITVPGLPRDTNPIRGLMYADDVAVFADSEQSLLAASTAIEQWANRWEMQFGVAKCGIISFTGHLAPRLDNPLDIRLHGQLVSRVESYKYLGVLIDSKLDHSAWLKQKRSALEHTISALHPVLANHQLTVNYRSRIFSAVVMGKAYYGLELVGGNKSHLAPLQTTINKGIRLFTGARLSTAIGPLLVETGIGSLLTRSLVSRVRLLERSVTKRTPINAICSGTDNDVFTLNVQGQLVRSQRWFWSRRTKQLYRNRYWLTPQVRPKTVKQRHLFALMETLRTCGDSASLQKYVTRQLLDTSGFFKDLSFDQSRAHGTRYLMLARMDALWTARKAIQIGILVDTHPFSVDHCILCDQQLLSTSIAHLVVECEQVTGHRIQSGLVPAISSTAILCLNWDRTRFGSCCESGEMAAVELARIFLDLKTKTEDGRSRAAGELRDYVSATSREAAVDVFAKFNNELYKRIFELISSPENNDKIAGIIAIDRLIDLESGDENTSKVSRFANYLHNILPGTDPQITILATKALGRLANPVGALSTDFVEVEIKRAFEWLQGERTDLRRFSAVLVLKELTATASSIVYSFVPQTLDLMWYALRDPKIFIREAAAEALSECLTLVQAREAQSKRHLYKIIFEECQKGFKMASADSVHGSLLAVKEILTHTAKACTSLLNSSDLFFDCLWMVGVYSEMCETVMKFKEHKDIMIRRTVMSVISNSGSV
ncbi:hypothetical protein BASA83_003827 [Batrachochytrium salamandrivorans]|nr:hypothetical protein BASA83_003827 [Batrachochytrium salamandrivorans]